MTKLTAEVLYTAGNKPTLSMGEKTHHSRMGNALHRWINDVTPGADESILCYASELEYEIVSGKRVFITQLDAGLLTASDDAHFNLVGLDATVGWKDISGHQHIFSSANLAGTENKFRSFDPPIRVAYSDGYRNIGVRVDANDASAVVGFSWDGWQESEE